MCVKCILEAESALISTPALFIKLLCGTDIQYLFTQYEILLQLSVLLLISSHTAEPHTLPASGPPRFLCGSCIVSAQFLHSPCVVPAWFLHGPCVVYLWFLHGSCTVLALFLHSSFIVPLWLVCGSCVVPVSFLHDSCMIPPLSLCGLFVVSAWFLCGSCMALCMVPVWFLIFFPPHGSSMVPAWLLCGSCMVPVCFLCSSYIVLHTSGGCFGCGVENAEVKVKLKQENSSDI